MKISFTRMHFICIITCVIISFMLFSLSAFSFTEDETYSWHQQLEEYDIYIQEYGKFKVGSRQANLHGHPWEKSPILAVLYSDTTVILLGSYDDDWLNVSVGALNGWMRSDQLYSCGPERVWAGGIHGYKYSRVQTKGRNVNLHPLPYVDSGDLGSYKNDRLVMVLGHSVNEKWYLVDVSGEDGFTGFMSASYLGKMLIATEELSSEFYR